MEYIGRVLSSPSLMGGDKGEGEFISISLSLTLSHKGRGDLSSQSMHSIYNGNFFQIVDKKKRFVDKVLTYDDSTDYYKGMRAWGRYLSTSAQLSFEKF